MFRWDDENTGPQQTMLVCDDLNICVTSVKLLVCVKNGSV